MSTNGLSTEMNGLKLKNGHPEAYTNGFKEDMYESSSRHSKMNGSPTKAANHAKAADYGDTNGEALTNGIIKGNRITSTSNIDSSMGANNFIYADDNEDEVVTSSSATSYVDAATDSVAQGRPKGKVYKVVLTGGPCGGKTTGQTRLCTFFENMGWKVLRVPETATVLLGGGIKFTELTEKQGVEFQEELLQTMMQIEAVFFDVAEKLDRDVLVICDRGTMDASAFISRDQWEGILLRNGWNEIELRDTRYNQIIHMVSAANGADAFYTIEDHAARSEGLELARELDHKAAQAWVGHPYFDVVDNSTDFETKICRMIQSVCSKLGIDTHDRLQNDAKKHKFLVRGPLASTEEFPEGFQDFSIFHDYLKVGGPRMQARLRKRGQRGRWTYTYTVRKPELNNQVVEVKTAITHRDYCNMLAQKDHNHLTVCKTRRCFLHNDQYFQLDIYKQPSHPRCKGLMLLETYSTLSGDEIRTRLPSFLHIVKEVTGDPSYSMFNLSLKESWHNNDNFCASLICTEDHTKEQNSEDSENPEKEAELTSSI